MSREGGAAMAAQVYWNVRAGSGVMLQQHAWDCQASIGQVMKKPLQQQ